MTIDAGPRLGRLTEDQLRRALDRFGLGALRSATPAGGGHSGQNLVLSTDTGDHLLRGNPAYPWQLPTERYFADLLARRAALPTPVPYRIDPGTDVFGWSYAILPRLPGEPLPDSDVRGGLNDTGQREVAGELGRVLARAHTVTGPRPGRWRPEADDILPFTLAGELDWPSRQPGAGPAITWRERVIRRCLGTLHGATRFGPATTPGDLAWAGRILDAAGPALDAPFTPTVVLEDFKPGNVHITGTAGRWSVSGLFDLTDAYFGDAEADLPRMLCSYLDADPALARVYLGSYAAARPARPGTLARFPAYLLADRALVWSFLQRHHLRYWPETWTFTDWAGRYLDLAHPVVAELFPS